MTFPHCRPLRVRNDRSNRRNGRLRLCTQPAEGLSRGTRQPTSSISRRPAQRERADALTIALLGWLLATPLPSGAGDLNSRLAEALAHPGFRGAEVAALVVRADDGHSLFERSADRLLTPASNVKILTAVASLATFGPTHRFPTRIYADAEPDSAGAVGALAVRGGGDAALTAEDWWRLTGELRRRGVQRVRGDILLDDSLFDRQRWHPAWGTVSARAYHAPVGALTANYSAFAVIVQPGKRPGDALRIAIDPAVPHLRFENRARSGPVDARSSLSIARQSNSDIERIVLSGVLPVGSDPAVLYRSVRDPLAYAGAVFRMQLRAHGIAVDGQVRPAAVPAGFREIHRFDGKPLAEIVRLFLKYSNNSIAEALVKAMAVHDSGPPGTWENGVRAVRRRLVSLGLDPSGFTIVDGSGLATRNRASARTLVTALRIARASFQFGPEFAAALPIAARDGTLERRATGAIDAVRAKTGLLAGATGLSGYARRHDGTDVIFSILVNGYEGSDAQAMAAVDGFASALVAHSAPPDAAR